MGIHLMGVHLIGVCCQDLGPGEAAGPNRSVKSLQ
jgi:hypothetical protein